MGGRSDAIDSLAAPFTSVLPAPTFIPFGSQSSAKKLPEKVGLGKAAPSVPSSMCLPTGGEQHPFTCNVSTRHLSNGTVITQTVSFPTCCNS
jgi:hypothetical protein